jgi:hypothetical protein
VENTKIRGLISRIESLLYNSIKSPLEDWYSIQLSLTEAISTIDKDDAKHRILEIYEEINLNVIDKDILICCYAQVWKTASQFYESFVDEVKRNFHRILCSLLADSANQWEMLEKSLFVISSIDIEEAIEIANSLNTNIRRVQAIGNIIIHGICENPENIIPKNIENIILELDENQRFNLLRELLSELWHLEKELPEKNQEILLRVTRKLDEPYWRAICLGLLAGIWSFDEIIRRERLVAEVYRNWKDVDDLRIRIFLGFELVEIISSVDRDQGIALFNEIQHLLIQPGSSLAAGRLGVSYKKSLELTISSLCKTDFENKLERYQKTLEFISMLPSYYARCQLYSQLAAKAYSLGDHPAAGKIVEDKILPELDHLYEYPQYWRILYYAIPILLKYHKDTAEKYITPASSLYQEIAWHISLVWQITLGNIYINIDAEKIKNTSTYPILSDLVLYALSKIKTDEIVYSSVIAITKCIEQSVINHDIDGTHAYDLLISLDEIAKSKLPDQNNIDHDGYLLVTQARIHSARSLVYNQLNKKGRFSKIDIRKGWTALSKSSKTIQNIADKVFVLITLAKEYSKYDRDGAKEYLHAADIELDNIPSIIDRSDRMQLILEVWGQWGYIDQAKYLIQKYEELLNQFEGYSRDQKLERLVQTVYEFDPVLAEELADRFYSRNPDALYNPIELKIASKEILKSPGSIVSISKKSDIQEFQAMIVQNAISDLLHAQSVNDSIIPPRDVLLEWVSISPSYDENTHFDILLWVSDCLAQNANQTELLMLGDYYLDSAFLVEGLSRWSSPSRREGIPKDLNKYLPGMEGRIQVFQAGEVVQAKKWVKEWIKSNAKDYLKIVDPYFGLSELEYLSGIPKECKVLIVTTDANMKYNNPDDAIRDINEEWKLRGKGIVPKMILLIVPKKAEGQFHCRAIVTANAGLDIGQSLNGLGLKTGKLTRLESEDSHELEEKYINGMLDHNSWFINLDTLPMSICISH